MYEEAVKGFASWYSTEACRYNHDPRCPTADGSSLYELERDGEDFIATWQYPLGSRVEVTELATGRRVIATVRDRGPARRLHRVADLSKGTFQKLDELRKGLIEVEIVPVE